MMRAQRQEQEAEQAEQMQLMQTAEAAGNAAPMVRAVEGSGVTLDEVIGE